MDTTNSEGTTAQLFANYVITFTEIRRTIASIDYLLEKTDPRLKNHFSNQLQSMVSEEDFTPESCIQYFAENRRKNRKKFKNKIHRLALQAVSYAVDAYRILKQSGMQEHSLSIAWSRISEAKNLEAEVLSEHYLPKDDSLKKSNQKAAHASHAEHHKNREKTEIYYKKIKHTLSKKHQKISAIQNHANIDRDTARRWYNEIENQE